MTKLQITLLVPSLWFLIAEAAWIPVADTITLTAAERGRAMNYLRNYGYMRPGLLPNDVNAAEKEMTEAILRLQTFFGLPLTGVLDEETLRLIKIPRCGVPDLSIFENPSRKRRYLLTTGPIWDKTDLTYNITLYTPDVPHSVVDKEIATAFEQWQSVSSLNFHRVTTGPSDIAIDFFLASDHGDDFPFAPTTLAHAFYPRYGHTHFNDAFSWWDGPDVRDPNDGTLTKSNLHNVALHEFGHALGLNHSDNKGSIMWPTNEFYVLNQALHDDDIQGIQKLYGPRTTTPVPTTTTTKASTTTTTPTTTPQTTTTTRTTTTPSTPTKTSTTSATTTSRSSVAEFCPGEILLCEGTQMTLRCPSGSTVQIQTGMFGRLDRVPCNSEPITPLMSSTCLGDVTAVTSALRARCDGRSACKVYSGNDYLGGDPCPATIKYLKFCYTCV